MRRWKAGKLIAQFHVAVLYADELTPRQRAWLDAELERRKREARMWSAALAAVSPFAKRRSYPTHLG